MRLRHPSLAECIVAAMCGLWVALFLAPITPWAIPAGLAAAAATTVLPQWPLAAGAALAALQWTLTLWHADENPAILAPFVIGVYSLGRYSHLWSGVAVALAYPLSATVGASPDSITVAFAIVLTAAVFAYGRVVQHRALTAERSRATASRLQDTDAESMAARIVRDERARLGGQALAVLRDAVEGMRLSAAAAQRDLAPDLIESIVARGRQAVTELRWLLGLLRSEPAPTPRRARRRQVRWVADVTLGGALVVIGVLGVWLSEASRSSPFAWAAAVGLPVCAVVRGRYTAPALGGAAVVVGFAAIAGVPLIATGLMCILLLAWSAGVEGKLVPWACFTMLAAVTITWVVLEDPSNLPILAALVALSAFAGHEWSAHDRAGRAAMARADELQANLDARVDEARREERLRIARELHDVASHAVGVMVLQASSAQVLRESDPAAAHRALSIVDTTAEQALTELAMMFGLLDSGAIGSPGLAEAAHEPLPALVERLSSAGLQIELHTQPVPSALEGTVYRIVQESLTNVVQHSDATNVQITVNVENGALSVRVADDGHATNHIDGFGLTGMAERVHALGGTFSASGDARGFAVEATIPLQRVTRS